jgi:hypothetical protein
MGQMRNAIQKILSNAAGAALSGVTFPMNFTNVGIDFQRLTRSHPSPLIPLLVEGRGSRDGKSPVQPCQRQGSVA